MGAAGSSNSVPPPPSPAPFRPRNEEVPTIIYGAGESYCPEYSNENIRQSRRTGTFDPGEQPRSQGPSPYSTLRDDDWWNQRPSAPSLSNLRNPRRETLLTYAAQMTGWQTAEGHNPSFPHHQQHQEAMELSRVVSQLAMANQQLASAHNSTLAHLEALYVELRRERESKKPGISSSDLDIADEALRKRLTEENDEDAEEIEERREMEVRIGRLENMLIENLESCQRRQRSHRQDEQKKLRSRIERLENLVKSQESYARDDDDCQSNPALCSRDRVLSSNDVPEHELTYQTSRVDDEQQKKSIQGNHNVDACQEASNLRIDEKTSHSSATLHLEKSEVEGDGNRVENTAKSEMIRLSEEIERLKAERLEYQITNERLSTDLAEQKKIIGKLSEDYEESKSRYEKVESSLNDQRKEYDELMKKFDIARKETERLLTEIDAFNLEKDTAEARISSLEQDLQKSQLEKEEIKSAEGQKALKLKAQLSEEVSDKKKQIKALEDALDEIQRLKETIKTERKSSEDDASKEDIEDPIELIEDNHEHPTPDRAANMDEFKKELTLKREARQRAIAAVSSEMERLRRELDAEKEAHSETSRVLDLLRSAQSEAETPNNEVEEDFKKPAAKNQKPDEDEIALKRSEAQRLTSVLKVSDELRKDIRFQMEKVDDLRYHLETEPEQHRYRIRYLTELTNKTKEAVRGRELHANEVKDHLAQILVRLGDRSFLNLKDDIGMECERQLENINSLKTLYNERLKVLTELKDAAVKELADVKEKLDHSLKKIECLEDDLKKADEKIDTQDTEISNLESQLGLTKADCRDLQNQMSLINGLFSQMLLGASSADMDLDRLTQLLQENHDLISDMAREEGTEAAALPKLLLDLIEQVEGGKGTQKRVDGENNGTNGEAEKKEDDLQQEDIAHNLPKVWRVLFELLSCHAAGTPTASVLSSSDPNSCYKSVDTPAGPRLVISVSKTYIRLKELILEKKHLEKEMNRMKQLNTHLESKLGEQEKRLSAVSDELTKTWSIVGRMQAQHQQLHTHEQILRYELQQKRKLLQELKQELEYCREKWASARQKNTNTELEWRSLRREFAARKALAVHDSFNNSAESGFSDERGDDSDEEDDAVEGRIRLGPRRRTRKESPRAPTPDTESEQPTDTELSDPKTGSSATLEQRTPTPETEAELDEIEIADADSNVKPADEKEKMLSPDTSEELDPLDQALTNVIQNLIRIDVDPEPEDQTETSKATKTDDSSDLKISPETKNCLPIADNDSPSLDNAKAESSLESPESRSDESKRDDLQSEVVEDSNKVSDLDGENAKTVEPSKSSATHEPTVTTANSNSTISIFSIGPFPKSANAPLPIKSVQFSEPLVVGPSNQFFAPVFGSPVLDVDNATCSPTSPARKSEECESKCMEGKRSSKSMENVNDSDSVSVDSSSSLDTVKEFPVTDSAASSSASSCVEQDQKKTEQKDTNQVITGRKRTPEEALAAREDRLKRLEEQADWLMKKMNATSRRGSALSTRLEELHEAYGEPPVPPPMPDVLPSRRLRTNLNDLPHQVPESTSTETKEEIEEQVPLTRSNESPTNNAP